ncbi:MAG: glycosyltransferase family 9 protein [Sedimentisphaeraceae bacterium JB056]
MFYYLDDTRAANKALIIHSGALGDCVLTLKLAAFLQKVLNIKTINFIGPGDYVSFMPGRTAVSSIRNIHSLKLDRMFTEPSSFELEEDDPLVRTFSGYDWIISFLGTEGSNFETNLAYLACFTSSPEIVMLSARSQDDNSKHISDFHIEELINLKKPSIEALGVENVHKKALEIEGIICPNLNDVQQGLSIVRDQVGIDCSDKELAVICPGSGGREKCWHIDNYISTAKELEKSQLKPLFLLGEVEFERFNRDDIQKLKDTSAIISSLNIEQVVGLLSIAKLYIGNDSGVSHISGAMQLPTVSIFGPTNPAVYKPIGSAAKALRFATDKFSKFDQESVEKVVNTALDTIDNASTPLFEIHI